MLKQALLPTTSVTSGWCLRRMSTMRGMLLVVLSDALVYSVVPALRYSISCFGMVLLSVLVGLIFLKRGNVTDCAMMLVLLTVFDRVRLAV